MPAERDSDEKLARALTGAWQLVSWTIEYPSGGRVTQPFGADPEGLLVYTSDGHMSAVMQRRRPAAAVARRSAGSRATAEKAAAFGSYLHYAGTLERRRWQRHPRRAPRDEPNLIGTRQVRSIALDGDGSYSAPKSRSRRLARRVATASTGVVRRRLSPGSSRRPRCVGRVPVGAGTCGAVARHDVARGVSRDGITTSPQVPAPTGTLQAAVRSSVRNQV